jgi:hypothetical protein
MTVARVTLLETLSPLDERICRLVAAGELSWEGVAQEARCSRSTVARRITEPRIQERVAVLREEFRAAAMRDAAFADKRARVIARNAIAQDLFRQLRASDYQAAVGLDDNGAAIMALDKDRLRLFDQYLASIAADLDDARGPGTQVGVAVKIYVDPRMEQPLEADWDDAPPPNNRPPPD